jgi:hypothetical protein
LKYQWQRNDGAKFVNLNDGSLFTGTTTKTLTVLSASKSTEGAYRCILTTSICSDTTKTATLTVNRVIPSNVPKNDLVGWWPFNCDAQDESGNGHHAESRGAVLSSDRKDIASTAYLFDGRKDHMIVSDSCLDAGWKSYTVSVWARVDSLSVIASGDGSATTIINTDPHTGFSIAAVGNKSFGTAIGDAQKSWSMGGLYSETQIQVGKWHHVVVVKDSSTVTLWVDGKREKSVSGVAQLMTSAPCQIVIGKCSCYLYEFFKGKIDDIGLWKRALSAEEIKKIHGDVRCNISITTHPKSDSVAPCSTKSLTVAVTADTSLKYQWQKNDGSKYVNLTDGSSYSGTNARQLTVLSASSATMGTYRCVVVTTACSDTTKVATLTLAAPPLPSYVPRGGLVGWWPFDCNADDQSGNSNHGVVSGATSAADRNGGNNKAYSFDGVDDYIVVDWTNSLAELDTRNQFTYSAWMNDRSRSMFCLMNAQHPSDDNAGWEVCTLGSVFEWLSPSFNSITNAAGRGCSPAIPQNEWRHVALAYDGTTRRYRLYVNGVLECTDTATVDVPTITGGKLYFGYSALGPDEYTNGLLDDIGLWNRALSEDEIKRLYGDDCSGGQRKYPLDSMRLSGVASYKESVITLTPSATFQAGSAWLPMKFDASRGFDVRFRFRMSDGSDNGLVDLGPQGADGVVFVMQNTFSAITGSAGDGIGYHGMPSGLAVEFDSYLNPAFSDPSTSHIAVQVGDGQIIRPWHTAPYLRGITTSGVPEFSANGTVYNARIVLQGQRLQVYCDTTGELKTPLLSVDSIDIRRILNLGADGATYMGITSATGFAQETHELLELSFQDCDQLVSVDDLPDEPAMPSGRVIPVPARQESRLELSAPLKGNAVCRIYDIRGIELAAGIIPAGQASWPLPISGLPLGSYRVQVQLEQSLLVVPMLLVP